MTIPDHYYIAIGSAPNPNSKPYETSAFGASIITVYKRLDEGHGSLPLQHVIEVGSFKIGDLDKKITAADFLKGIREGIEKLTPKNEA